MMIIVVVVAVVVMMVVVMRVRVVSGGLSRVCGGTTGVSRRRTGVNEPSGDCRRGCGRASWMLMMVRRVGWMMRLWMVRTKATAMTVMQTPRYKVRVLGWKVLRLLLLVGIVSLH